jgi:chromosome partitioning protein
MCGMGAHCDAGDTSCAVRPVDRIGGGRPSWELGVGVGGEMKKSIAVMNTKGGVGKSTIVLAIAETLSAFHGKNVLVIDSDAQASVSSMLMTVPNLYKLQTDGLTIVDYLVSAVLNNAPTEWTRFVVRNVSDVDDARSVYLIPSDMQLTLFEREVSKESLHTKLRSTIGTLLAEAEKVFDVVLVDCPPGLSVLTESWLREASLHLSPTKPDYVSICGLEVFRRFKALNPEMGFAENLGVVVNMKDRLSAADEEYSRWLRESGDNRCFEQALPRSNSMQDAARFQTYERSYQAKYPGEIGQALRALTAEILVRMAAAQAAPVAPQNSPPVVEQPAA